MASAEAAAFARKAHDDLRAVEVLIAGGLPGIAVARAYFAMFHAAYALVVELGLVTRRHGQVQPAIGRHYVRPGILAREHHRSLSTAERDRRRADYQAEPGFTDADARELLHRAREFVMAAEALLPP